MKLLTYILSVLILTVNVSCKDWQFVLNPDSIRIISANRMQKHSWFIQTHSIRNMVNLSFFTGRGAIPPYKDSMMINLRNPLGWPVICIGDSCSIGYDIYDSKFIVSGYPILLKNGVKQKIRKSFFSRRVCPRTVMGIRYDGKLILYVTTGANLKMVQSKMVELGCHSAINLDGGSSTFLYLDGKRLWSSKQSRSYPNVLSW